jgi:hypothetical protein
MFARSLFGLITLVILTGLMSFFGCKRDLDVLSPVAYSTDANVFVDGFGPGVQFEAFGDSKLDALSMDNTVKYDGLKSLKITVPNDGDKFCTYPYAGGALVSAGGRNLSGYNALTFWAKSTAEATFNFGLGNDNTGTSKYTAQESSIALHTIWTKYVLPIPSSAKLTKEKGLFYFAASNLNGAGFTFWLNDIKYESLGTLAYPQFSITSKSVDKVVNDTLHMDNPTITFNNNGTNLSVSASASYLTYSSTDSSIASVDNDGVVTALGGGSAVITAKLGNVKATGAVTINSKAAAGPTTVAATPTMDASKVISLFSEAYTNQTVDSWAASWGTGSSKDTTVAGNAVKVFYNLGFTGVDFSKHLLNASNMTHLHMDIWTCYPTTSGSFKVKLVDLGADSTSGGGDDSQGEVTYTATTSTPLKTGAWVSLDIPLSDFALKARSHLAQLIISGDMKVVWVDNIYFYQGKLTEPLIAAPTPAVAAANVISIFSDAYTNQNVTSWDPYWGNGQVQYTDRMIGDNNVKVYTNLKNYYVGITFDGANMIDATNMNYFHMDVWTPDSVTAASNFRITLVDFGANGIYGTDDASQELSFTPSTSPALVSGTWMSFELPLSKFTGLTTKKHLAQIVLAATGNVSTIWVDNIYFHK